MRVVQLVLFVVLVVVVLAMLQRPRHAARRRATAVPDELVKDPVCLVYVVRSRAVTRQGQDGPVYFCSDDCARRYVARAHG